MKLKRIAEAYKTSVDGLAKMLGYSKQALYYIASPGKKSICTDRMNAAMKSLKQKSDDMYLEDIARANIDKREREELLRKFCKQVGMVDVTNQSE